MATAGHKRQRSHSRDDVDHERSQPPKPSRLQERITELIHGDEIQNQPPGASKSKSLRDRFIPGIWSNIREDFDQMTKYLKEDLKKVLEARHIDAEVLSRVKQDSSITETLKRREKGLLEHGGSGFNSYQDIFREMHDLSGLRIVLKNREDRDTTQRLIEELFIKQKPPAHFDPNREVGQFWRKPWFGAYETHNHRVQLRNDNGATPGEALGSSHQYSGVMFEIQLTTFSDDLYNRLAHRLLYKADAGLVTEQEEMVLDVSHGLARCFELCMKILRPKLHRDTDNKTTGTAEDVGVLTEDSEEFRLAKSVVDGFEKDLQDQPESDPIAQLLRKLLSKKEDAEDQACLKDLLVSHPRDDKKRIEETKGGLLPRSYDWILGDHDFRRWLEDVQRQPFWITGAPGKGKTMMLCGIINELGQRSDTNVSYFFCQGTNEHYNTGTAVLRGLLFLLCKQQHSLISHIRHNYDDAGGKLFEDPNAWFALSGIFKNVLRDLSLRPTYLIVDALDECQPESRRQLTDLIFQTSKDYPTVKWILSSRELDEFRRRLLEATHLSLESKGESISEAVNAYIDFKVTNLRLREQGLGLLEVRTIADELRKRSEGTFLWVSIVCKELESAQEYEVMEVLQEMPEGLTELYGKLIQDIKALKRKAPIYCQSILRAVAVAFRPLTLKEVQELADLPRNVPADTIAKMCRSFLTTRDETISFVHQSAKDYLSEKWNTIFQSPIQVTHESMFSRSVKAMKRTLQQDIYNLGYPGIPIEKVQIPSPDPLVSVRYSCVYWIAHLCDAQSCSAEDQVLDFLNIHFLHWFEALSLIKSASTCVYALRDLVTLYNKGPWSKPLLSVASDLYRFSQTYGAIIQKAPLQAYSSALIFSPARSQIREAFISKEPDWIVQKPRIDENWNSCLATLTGHFDEVFSVAFSPDGRRIVSGSGEGVIKIWDAESGAEILTLQGHTDSVWSVDFDREGKFITSMSDDTIVKTWDIRAGDCVSTCEDPKASRYESACSSHKSRTAYPGENAVGIEDESGDTKYLELWGHSEPVLSVAFSPDGRLLASASDDMTVKIWDAGTGDELSTLRGHTRPVLSVCFSPDGHRIASGSEDATVKIWDVESSVKSPTQQSGYSHIRQVLSVALSLDGCRIASGSEDNTVKIWDAGTGDNIQTLEYESGDGIWSVTFSPDGRHIAAGTVNGAFVISAAESGSRISTCRAPNDGPFALSLEGCYIATWWQDNIQIKEVKSDRYVVALSGHCDAVTSLAFSPQDCHIVTSASRDKTIKIWNIVTGAEIASVNMGTEPHLLRFDPTGAFLYVSVNGAPLLPSQHSTWSLNSTLWQTEIMLPQLRQHEYGVNKDCSWITRQGRNVLWLPPELRATDILVMPWDVLPDMISIGCSSGRVWWVKFSSNTFGPPFPTVYDNSGVSE